MSAPPEIPAPPEIAALAGGEAIRLQGGRTPVWRGPRGVVRAGPEAVLARERAGLSRLVEALPALADRAPRVLDVREGAHLETDLGLPVDDPVAALAPIRAAFLAAQREPEVRVGTLRELLLGLSPPGGVKPTALVRALRAARDDGAALPFPPKQRALQRALDRPLEVAFTRTWAHGGLGPGRVLAGGLCRWRFCGPDRLDGEDLAPFVEGSLALDVGLHALKYAWGRDPLRAARLLRDLGLVDAPPPPVVRLRVDRAHPGVDGETLAAILGCAPGEVPSPRAARALGRAKGLVLGGVPLVVSTEPALRLAADPGFRTPRGRDPRRLFSLWDRGVRLDPIARASLTPEAHAMRLARRLVGGLSDAVVLDGFCGAGGDAIALARTPGVRRVIALDVDPERLAQARHNAAIYGVSDRIDFRRGDFFAQAGQIETDVCYLDPPWSGGAELIQRAWDLGRGRYRRGAIKLPRDQPAPEGERLEVVLTAEGFPSFVVARWG